MEITSFVLGMLTIVAVIILTAIVAGMVKISKLEKKSHNLYELCSSIEGDLRREIEKNNQDIWRQLENTGRDITMVERTIMQRIDKEIENTHRHVEHEIEVIHKHEEELHREIDQARKETGNAVHTVRTDLSSYIDSRIDKVIMKGTFDSSKQILNG